MKWQLGLYSAVVKVLSLAGTSAFICGLDSSRVGDLVYTMQHVGFPSYCRCLDPKS